MNKIAIVGHPTSGYLEVEALLHQCGMQSAQPSRREGLSPQDITATLCKAHKAPPLDTVVEEDEIPQIQAGPVWHGMALDLMLGNLDLELWGWADPQALYALDYWKDLDPKLTFVLVYDEPHRVLIHAGRPQGEPPSAQELRRRLDNWVAYNRALLRFHLRHPQRCLLVHSQQVRRALDSYLQQLQPLIDAPLLRAPAGATPATLETERGDDSLAESAAMPHEWAVMVSAAGIDPQHAARVLSAGAAERHLVEDMLADHPVALHTYAELESAANLPWGGAPKAPRDAEAAWQAFVRQRALVSELLTYADAEQRRASDALDQLRKELDDVRQQAHAQLIHLTHTSDRLEAERSRLEQALQAAQAQHSKLQAELDGTREQAQTQAQAVAQREQQAQELREENELLLSQLHQVQEELERHHLEKQALSQRIEAQAAEMERQAEQIRARLGELQAAEAARTGLASELQLVRDKAAADARAAQSARAKLEEELKRTREQAQTQAQAVAEREQQAQELREENELLLSQLHQVQEELERYYLENQQLKAKLPKPKPPGPYGAADRIKRQLSYRLGAVMIQRSRTVSGWVGMPWALWAEARAFRKERAASGHEKLPPIHTYRDAHEAERVKKHLSYRLGKTLIDCSKSPVGWVKLPFALHRQVREFRLERAGNGQ